MCSRHELGDEHAASSRTGERVGADAEPTGVIRTRVVRRFASVRDDVLEDDGSVPGSTRSLIVLKDA